MADNVKIIYGARVVNGMVLAADIGIYANGIFEEVLAKQKKKQKKKLTEAEIEEARAYCIGWVKGGCP